MIRVLRMVVRMGFRVLLGGVLMVLQSQGDVAMGQVRVMSGLFVITRLMSLVGFMMMMGCSFMVLRCVQMVRMS